MDSINIKTIINKSQEEIKKILGKPDKVAPGKWRYHGTVKYISGCPTNFYKNGLIEIKFIADKAVRITIYNTECKYPDGVLSYLCLKETSPSFVDKNITEWKNVEDIYRILAFPDGNGKVLYTYIVTKAEYR